MSKMLCLYIVQWHINQLLKVKISVLLNKAGEKKICPFQLNSSCEGSITWAKAKTKTCPVVICNG